MQRLEEKSRGPQKRGSARRLLCAERFGVRPRSCRFFSSRLTAAVLLYRRLLDWNWGRVRNPASKLAGRKAAASRPHSKAGFARRGCRLAQTPDVWCLRSPEGTFSSDRAPSRVYLCHALLPPQLDYLHNNPVTRGLVNSPQGLAVVKLEVLLLGGCVNSPHGPYGVSSTSEQSLREIADSRRQESAPAGPPPLENQ
jgi:hypothetical protein